MNVTLLTTRPEVDALGEQWQRLHAGDPHAGVFMSWPWMRAWRNVSPFPFAVLAAREPTGEVAGLLPISPRGFGSVLRLDQPRELHFAGDPAADERGMLCEVKRQADVLDAFASHLSDDGRWDRVIFRDVTDPRVSMLLRDIARRTPRVALDDREGNVAPWLDLPASWEEYLRESLTPESRKSLKKRLRIAASHGATLQLASDTDPSRRDSFLDVLLRLTAMRRGESAAALSGVRHLLQSCMAAGCAEVSLLELDGEPAAAQGSFLDRKAGSIGHYVTGFDARFAALSPGRVLDAMCIQRAIADGWWRGIDFLRGDEPYKRQLGARPRSTRHITLTRSSPAARLRRGIDRMRTRLGV